MSPLVHLEDYLDTLTAVPQTVQRSLSKLAELDGFVSDSRTLLTDALQALQSDPGSQQLREAVAAHLSADIERVCEKRAVSEGLLLALTRHCRTLEDELLGFQEELRDRNVDTLISSKRQKTAATTTTATILAARKKGEECICGGKGRGEMVGCENPNCPSEWFHLQCMGLNRVPAGKWFCPECILTARKL